MSDHSEAIGRLREEAKQDLGGWDFPASLPLSAISLAVAVFQIRSGFDGSGVADHRQVHDLRRALSSGPLDPVMVYRAGGKNYLVDGHHRIAAYRAQGGDPLVSVKWVRGSLDEAITASVAENSKTYLNLGQGDRLAACWRLVRLGTMTKAAIQRAAGVSESTVSRQRRLLLEFKKRFPLEDVGEMDDVRSMLEGGGSVDRPEFDREAAIGRIIEALDKAFGKNLRNRPDLFGEALECRMGDAWFSSMCEARGYVEHEYDEEDMEF